MKVREKKWIRFRIYVVAAFFLVGLATVSVRAFQLQILEKDRLEAIARAGYIGVTKLLPERGTIYDREHHELALSVAVKSVYAHPNQITDKAETARKLSRVLGERRDKILDLLRGQRSFAWITRRTDPNRAEQVEALNLPGVCVTSEPRRYYPGKEIAAHLIGFVGDDNQGLEGLEKEYDQLLCGPEYDLIQMRNALGQPFTFSRPILSGHGMHDLVLTIDKDIQYKAQQAIKSVVERTSARSGHCIVVDPATGEILAMAVAPEFNPNVFSKYRPQVWRNRAVTDCFEPGSTIKAFLLAACLEEGVITPYTRVDCEQGEYDIGGGHMIHDLHKYGVLSVSDIIMHSSNIGAVKTGRKLGYAAFYEYLKKFGFGSKTGDDLLGERTGFIRPAEQTKPIDQAALYFGQGMTTTSLQLAMAMATIANGGKLMRPIIVKAIVDESGKIVKENGPEVVRTVISKKTAMKTARILEGVVTEEGTGPEAAISGFRVAGKTGTAQKVDPKTKKYSSKKYVATFIGFVPADEPKLVIVVVIDEPKGVPYGGVVAGPVFSALGEWSLHYLGINPQVRWVDRTVKAPEDVKEGTDPDLMMHRPLKIKAGFLPDFRGLGMREVLRKGKSLGLTVLLEGSGLAVSQHPGPGTPLKKINAVQVSFSPPA
jgi:cell division protein FtsI (penicillin-binding protein 3)